MRNKWFVYFLVPLLAGASFAAHAQDTAPKPKVKPVSSNYVPKDYSYLYGMPGFDDALLKMHFQLYQGYVKNTNLLMGRFKELDQTKKQDSYDYGALKRRFGWEWNGM